MPNSALYALIARTGHALAHGTRLEVLEALAQRDRAVTDLAECLGVRLTTLSAHLQVLRDAGLVEARRDGTSIVYRLASDDVALLVSTLAAVAERHRPDVHAAAAPFVGENVALDELRSDTVLIDVRPADEFLAGHLPGAINVPVDQLISRLDQIPERAHIIAYCRGRYCSLAHEAAARLRAEGRIVSVLDHGVLEWRARTAAAAS